MGYTLWSDAHYRRHAAELAAAGRSAFGFDQDIREQRAAAGVHPLMDPARLTGGRRESRGRRDVRRHRLDAHGAADPAEEPVPAV